MNETDKAEVEAYLAKIRRTVERSRSLIEAAQLRIAETDRLLAAQGITREELSKMRFSREQREAVNAELRRGGFEPLEDIDYLTAEVEATKQATKSAAKALSAQDEFSARQGKFGAMMRRVRL